jgi:hypothetical protein
MSGQIKLLLVVFLFAGLMYKGFSQKCDSLTKINDVKSYPFIIQDSPSRLFTMRQIDQDYLSSYRLLTPFLGKYLNPAVLYISEAAGFVLFWGPLSHEEAHRSILVSKNIGAVSQPFFLSQRGGYVDGVTDAQLKQLRDSNFPVFARMHTAGLESDYSLISREEELQAFEEETYKNIAVEYLLRKAMLMQYYLICLFHYDIDGPEETDELKRDIVGNDVYGIVRHWHRPSMEYKRYTLYNELTVEEKTFIKRMGFRSFLNLLNVNAVGIRNFPVFSGLKMNFGMGYTLSPFGDFMDETAWLKYRNEYKVSIYLREFQNRNTWFTGGGIGIHDLRLIRHFETSLNLHFWNQPQHLDFNETKGQTGGALELVTGYRIYSKKPDSFSYISLDLGVILKTEGFLPGEIVMDRHAGLRFGISFGLDKTGF